MTLRQRRMDASFGEIEKLVARREKLLIRIARLTDKITIERRKVTRLAKYVANEAEPLPPPPKTVTKTDGKFEPTGVTMKERLRERLAHHRAQRAQ